MIVQKEQRSPECRALLESIPGGVLLCLNDGVYTVLEISRGFTELFGFTGEEISARFHDKFIEMIHPDDRQAVLSERRRQLAAGDKITLTYRVLCADGGSRAVLENAKPAAGEDGCGRLICVLTDITETRMARDELRLSLERFQIVMDQTTDIIFEWNIPCDIMTYSSNWVKKFGYEPVRSDFSRQVLQQSHIHPDDMQRFAGFMREVQGGREYAVEEFRFRNAQGRYIWCKVRCTEQYDGNGLPLKAIGIIIDIDDEKQMIDSLRCRAERDALTGLYNREETERRIREYLSPGRQECCALLMIDTDNFKQVNDSQGHLFGDAVLAELAGVMKRLTRRTDVVGRIGGDEFTIFLKDVPSREMVGKKTAELLDACRHIFDGDKHLTEVTCSAGAAMYPDDGRDFQSLYRSADMALYQAKSKGKNRFVFFDPDNAVPVDQIGYSVLGSSIDSDRSKAGVDGDLINYVFQILYDTSDIDRAIQLILEIVGKRFDVSRAYIFENSEDNLTCSNTYEWCNQGIQPQKELLQNCSYAEFDGYERLFEKNSIFYCRDVRTLSPKQIALFENQGVRATLQCAVRAEGRLSGFAGFDECTGLRTWTKDEVSVLTLISQLLTIFIQKKRATDRDRQMVQRLNTILDMQDAYVYAIDRNTYELYYLNRKTRELDAEARPGMTCHRAFFGREKPCEKCPLAGCTEEFYNPRYKVWTKVQVAPMKWGEKDSYLLTCFDVTQYMRRREQDEEKAPEQKGTV